MNQFFVESSAVGDGKITITGSDVNHIANVLRLKIGEEIQAIGLHNQLTYYCEIEQIEKKEVLCKIIDVQSESTELPIEITLYQGLPKGDKLEFVIQKAVEMGATRIVPVSMKRSVVKVDPKKADNKLKRWQAIAESAASQSKRCVIPEVCGVTAYKLAVDEASNQCDYILLPYELANGMDETRKIMNEIVNSNKDRLKIAIFIGPEGGFEEKEVEYACEKGAKVITLGKRILRTETAPLAILAWLTYLFEK